ncbi:uncharacterized protein LOC102681698 [Apis dorsata]|uniref:uncharacterized protein LOC102681698 n=1 Tax=Apis dorsata TaxID=7462 RepID=UPI0003DF74E2|nr:uncharacterized protein LOC102681698 [Apis dorsata]XP_006621248.1 uncharacterized protein LOC102681698 [Apis dorsata]
MAFQLDDLLKEDKKDANLLPDLSKAICNSQEEFRRLLENCPEFKIKPEKVKKEDAKVRDKEFSWKPTKKELKAFGKEWNYGNPIPPDMKDLNLHELQQVAIDWRMLTPIRPKNRQDEEMFSRLVEMGKLEAKTIAKEQRSIISPIRRTKNRAGMIESSVKICSECGEEYCLGEFCGDVIYDLYVRINVTVQQPKIKISADTEAIIANMDRKKKRKRKKRIKIKNTRKNGRLLIRSKRMKSIANDLGRKSNKDKLENNENNSKPIKPFKRKCSKYTKKGFRK